MESTGEYWRVLESTGLILYLQDLLQDSLDSQYANLEISLLKNKNKMSEIGSLNKYFAILLSG